MLNKFNFSKRIFSLKSIDFRTKKLFYSNQESNVEYRELIQSYTNLKTSYASSVSEFPLVSKSIKDLLDERASTTPNSLGFAFPFQGINLKFGELKERVDTVVQNLLNIGLRKGDRFAIALPNAAELLITNLAASQIGLITVLLNPAYQLVEFEYMLKKTGAKALLIYDTFKVLRHIDIIKKLCPEIETSLPGIIIIF
jgi:non-ribosomal peptide synthetase component E (peptide arylation enzyme)